MPCRSNFKFYFYNLTRRKFYKIFGAFLYLTRKYESILISTDDYKPFDSLYSLFNITNFKEEILDD